MNPGASVPWVLGRRGGGGIALRWAGCPMNVNTGGGGGLGQWLRRLRVQRTVMTGAEGAQEFSPNRTLALNRAQRPSHWIGGAVGVECPILRYECGGGGGVSLWNEEGEGGGAGTATQTPVIPR